MRGVGNNFGIGLVVVWLFWFDADYVFCFLTWHEQMVRKSAAAVRVQSCTGPNACRARAVEFMADDDGLKSTLLTLSAC